MRSVALSPALAPARSRLGKALPGFVLSVLLLHAGTFLPPMAAGSGVAEAATATAKTKKKTTTKKHVTTHKKSRSKSRHARVRPANYVNARAALLIDAQTGEVLYDKNSGTPMPIASLTKLMTAMVFLESKPDLSRRVMVSREDLAGSGHTQLRAGEVLTLRDLLHGSLLSSDNAATRSLVRNSGLDSEEFLARMNRKAQVMGLANTRFVEFTGLSELNVSSASEYAQILKTASLHPLIAHITTLPDYEYRSSTRDHYLVNTNPAARVAASPRSRPNASTRNEGR